MIEKSMYDLWRSQHWYTLIMRKILYTGLRVGLEVMPQIFRGEAGDLGKWERCQKLRIYHTQIAKKSLGRSDQRSARGGRASAEKTPQK